MKCVISVFAIVGFLFFSACSQNSSESNPVYGAWEMIEYSGESVYSGKRDWKNVQPSVLIFMEGYYSINYIQGEEKRPVMPDGAWRGNISVEQANSIWKPYTSNTGQLEITASQIVTTPIVAIWPNFMEGGKRFYDYHFEGDELIMSFDEENANGTYRLRRLP